MGETLLIDNTVKLVCAYVARNSLPAAELPTMIARVHKALENISKPSNSKNNTLVITSPSEIKSSISHERINSFIDGKSYKSLKRHLTANGFTPEQYRVRYGLPADYPMVAPAYAVVRSRIAMRAYYGDKAV